MELQRGEVGLERHTDPKKKKKMGNLNGPMVGYLDPGFVFQIPLQSICLVE